MMKAFFKYLIPLLALAACEKTPGNDAPPVHPSDGLVSLDVKINLPVVGSGKDTVRCCWSKGDTVGVFDGRSLRPFIAGNAGKSAVFSGRVADTTFFFAVYPYHEGVKSLDEFSVSEIQAGIVGMPTMKDLLFMGGFRPASPVCDLASQSALLKVDVPAGVRTILLRSNGPEAVCGSVMDGPVGNTLRIVPAQGTSLVSGTHYIQLRAGVFKTGLTCVMTYANENSVSCLSGSSSVSVNRGGIYDSLSLIAGTSVSYSISGLDSSVDLASVSLALNKESGIYGKGEAIELKASSRTPSRVIMKVLDGGLLSYVDVLDLNTEEKVVFRASYDEMRSIGFMAFLPGQKYYAGVGALVAPEEFVPGYDMPSDFVAWWDSQKQAMRASSPEVKLTPASLSGSDALKYDCWALEISMPEGNPARGYMAVPKNAAPGSLPIYMYFHSAGVNKTGNRATAAKAVSMAGTGKGCIALDLNAHGMLDDQPQSYYDNLNSGELKNYSTRALTTREAFYFRLMYLREVRALDYLCSRTEWDGKRVLAYGESQGGGQAAAICGLDGRVGAAVLNVPAMTDWGGAVQGRQAGWSKSYQSVASTDLGKKVLPYFDGALMLQHTKAKLWMLAGHIDDTCHPACVWAAYNTAGSTDKKMVSLPYRRHSMLGTDTSKQYFNSVVVPDRDKFIADYLK